MYVSDKLIVQVKPIMGMAIGVRYEEDLIGSGSHTMCFDLLLVTVFVTW